MLKETADKPCRRGHLVEPVAFVIGEDAHHGIDPTCRATGLTVWVGGGHEHLLGLTGSPKALRQLGLALLNGAEQEDDRAS